MGRRLTAEISDGLEQAGANCSGGSVALRIRASSRSAKRQARDQLLLDVIDRYRKGNRSLWAPLLLELLAPAIHARLVRLKELPLGMLEDEVANQLVLEVLEAALTAPMAPGSRDVEQRLVRRAGYLVGRWLARERRRQGHEFSLGEIPE